MLHNKNKIVVTYEKLAYKSHNVLHTPQSQIYSKHSLVLQLKHWLAVISTANKISKKKKLKLNMK